MKTKEFKEYLNQIAPEVQYVIEYLLNGKPKFISKSYPSMLPPVWVLQNLILEIQDRNTKPNSSFNKKLEITEFKVEIERENGMVTKCKTFNIERIPRTLYWRIID